MGDEINLIIEDQTIKCSKKDLIERSDYFKAMFEGNFLEHNLSSITLNDIDLNSMNIIMKLFWDDSLVISESDILKVLQTSCMLQFNDIKQKCIENIIECLNAHNCLDVWFVSEALSLNTLSLKAKTLAMIKFNTIKDSDNYLDLNLKQLHLYLSNIHLASNNEIEVFKTCKKWFTENGDNNENILIALLSCIDFNSLSNEDLKCIKDCSYRKFNSILNNIAKLRNNEVLEDKTEVQLAKKCLLSKHRVKEVPAIFKIFDDHLQGSKDTNVETTADAYKRKRKYTKLSMEGNGSQKTTASVMIYDQICGKFSTQFSNLPVVADTVGFEVVGYKHKILVFGGEVGWGTGYWVYNFMVFDGIKEKWQKKTELPICRRHFQTCVCGSLIFIVGGIEKFRKVAHTMFYYNIKNDEWSPSILLPAHTTIHTCNYKDQLFLLDLSNRKGYLFDRLANNFINLPIVDKEKLMPKLKTQYTVFSYREKIYATVSGLLEMEIRDQHLYLTQYKPSYEKLFSKQPDEVFDIRSVVCGDTAYIAYTLDGMVSVDIVDLTRLESTTFPEPFPKDVKLFSMQQLCKSQSDIFVNDLADFTLPS